MQNEIKNSDYKNLNYIPLSEAGKILSTSRDYVNVLIRRGKLRAVKLGRNWVTTNEWLLEYQRSVGRFTQATDSATLKEEEKSEFENLKTRLVLESTFAKVAADKQEVIERLKKVEASVEDISLLRPALRGYEGQAKFGDLEISKFRDFALGREIIISSRELKPDEKLAILETVKENIKSNDVYEFQKASRYFGVLASLKSWSSLKLFLASAFTAVFLIFSLTSVFGIISPFKSLSLLNGLSTSKYQALRQNSGQAALVTEMLQGFPKDIPEFSNWMLSLFKTKPIQELAVGTLESGKSKLIQPKEGFPKITTFEDALALDVLPDLSAEALAKAEAFPFYATTTAGFLVFEDRLSALENTLIDQIALVNADLSLQKKTILGTLGTLIGISKLLPTHPISTVVVQGSPATLTTYSIQPQVNTSFDRLSANYFNLSNDATINGRLTVNSGGTFNTLSVSGAGSFGSLSVSGDSSLNTLTVSGLSTLGDLTVNGILTIPGNATFGNASTTYFTVSNTAWITNGTITNASTTYLTISNNLWGDQSAFSTSVQTPLIWNNGTLTASTTGAYPLIFATDSSERMRIDESGKVFIATTTMPSGFGANIATSTFVYGNQFISGGLGVGAATTTSGAIQTSGDVFVGRNLYVSGNSTVLGGSLTDTLTVNSSINSDLVPNENNVYDLGSPSFYWSNLYIDTINANNISGASTSISGTKSADFTINTDNTSVDQENSNLIFYRGTVPPNAVISWNAATSSKRFEFNQAARFFNESASTTNSVLTVQGNTGLTANAFQVLDVSTSTTLFSVNPVSQKTTMVNASTTNLTVSGNLWTGSGGNFTVGGTLLLPDGSVSSPSLSFTNDTDTGIFRIADNKFGLATGATTSLTLDNGKVIVGNDILTASYQLEVADRDAFNNTIVDELRLSHFTTGTADKGLGTGLLFYGQDSTGAGQNLARVASQVEHATSSEGFLANLSFHTVGSGGLLEKMRITGEGNVGIGTTSPNNLLSLFKSTTPALGFTTGSGDSAWTMGIDTADANKFKIASSTAVGTNTRLTIDGNGNVGIGTTSPAALLHVVGNIQLMGDRYGASPSIILRRAEGTVASPSAVLANQTLGVFGVRGYGTTDFTNSVRAFVAMHAAENWTDTEQGAYIEWRTTATAGTSTTEKMRLTDSGNVGIGTTSPNNLLTIAAATTPALGFTTNAGLSGWTMGIDTADANKFKIASSTAVGTNTRLTIDGNGNVGIGTASPSQELHISRDSSDPVGIKLTRASTGATGGNVLVAERSRGTIASPLAISSGDAALSIQGFGFDGSTFVQSTEIQFDTEGTIASTRVPGVLRFFTGTDASPTVRTERMTINSAGNVGIGTTSPGSLLSLNNSAGNYNSLFTVASSTISATTTLFTILNSGFVGIGTDNPTRNLQVVQNQNAVTQIRVQNLITSGNTAAAANVLVESSSSSGQIGAFPADYTTAAFQDRFAVIANSDASGLVLGGTSSGQDIRFFTDGSAASNERMRIDSSGNVGIGTSTGLWARTTIAGGGSTSATAALSVINSASTSLLFVRNDGNVGIGTTSPNNLLTLFKSTTPALGFTTGSGESAWTMGIDTADQNKFKIASSTAVGTNTRLTIDGNGNVGIGTESPGFSEVASSAYPLITIIASGTAGGRIEIGTSRADANDVAIGSVSGVWTTKSTGHRQVGLISILSDGSTANQRGGAIVLYTKPDAGTSVSERMRITNSGLVGIGTTTPTQFLTISKAGTTANANIPNGALCIDNDGGCVPGAAGNITFRSSTTGGSDVAENYLSSSNLEAGDIVASVSGINIDKATTISKTVIGIVSTAPGMTLGYDENANASSTYPVALVGRVPTKVSLENGPVAIGDRISVSSVAGIGKKASSTEATVGIALEPFDGWSPSTGSGQSEYSQIGKVLVFVNLGQPTLAASGGTGDLAFMTTASGDLNLDGHSLLNVKSISGLNNLWSIDENGNITAQSVQTQSLTIGGGAASGVTIYDRSTSAPKCIYIEGGVIKTSDGACGTTTNAGTQALISNSQAPIFNEAPMTNDQTATTTTSILSATSTPEIAPVSEAIVATSTEPVIVSTTTMEMATTTP
ncbi:MAG: hypothetical protein HYW79_01785 [Parcubacteria group bacterium]|nr:hypothetical protein [Parcubacteria group bacterium]